MLEQFDVTLNSIKVRAQNDFFGDDKARLILLPDDEPPGVISRAVEKGESWSLNHTARVRSAYTLQLFERDPGSHDRIDQRSLSLVAGQHTTRLAGDGARYDLTYTVKRVSKALRVRPTHVRIELVDVACSETEDFTGDDHFYVAAVSDVGGAQGQTLTQPVAINNMQQEAFDLTQRLVFDGDIGEGVDRVSLGISAFEEDAGASWARNRARYEAILNQFAQDVRDWGNDDDGGIDLAADGGERLTALVGNLVEDLDADDHLGRAVWDIDVADVSVGTLTRHLRLRGDGADYTLRVRFIFSAPGSALPAI